LEYEQTSVVFLGGGFGSVFAIFYEQNLNTISPNFYFRYFFINYTLGGLSWGIIFGRFP